MFVFLVLINKAKQLSRDRLIKYTMSSKRLDIVKIFINYIDSTQTEPILVVITTFAGIVLAIGIVTSQKLTKNNYSQDDTNNICRDLSNNTPVANNISCRDFFVCRDQRAVPYRCPEGHWFNPDQGNPGNSDPVSSHCRGSPHESCNPDNDFELCPPSGIHFFPHEEYCNKFIMCFAGFPILRHCAEGLYFDRELRTCNFPEYAECELEVCPPYNDHNNITFVPSDTYCDKYGKYRPIHFILCSTTNKVY